MGILLGLFAAFSWGAADFNARSATREIGTYRTLLFMQFFGIVGLGGYLSLSGELSRLLSSDLQTWGWVLLAALLNTISSLALYRAFEIGIMSIVSPLGASYAAVTVVLALLSGERVSPVQLSGMGVIIPGAILTATSFGSVGKVQNRSTGLLPPGVLFAVIAAIGYGVCFWLLGERVAPIMGGVGPVWIFRVETTIVLLLLARPLHQELKMPKGGVWWNLAIVGVLDTTAFVATAIGLTLAQVSVVSVLSSLFSAVTVVLAWIFLKERLRWSQWIGIIIILAGIGCVNIQ